MPCSRRVRRRYKPALIRELSSLSYGLDSEEEEASGKNITHLLTVAGNLLQATNYDPGFLKKVITGDKSLVYSNDPETKAQSSQKLVDEVWIVFGPTSYILPIEIFRMKYLNNNAYNSEEKKDDFPKYLWRMLLMDAWVIWKVRSFFESIIIWWFFISFLGITTVLIIGPSKQYKLSQQEILQLGVEEKDTSNSSITSLKNENSREIAMENVKKNDYYTVKVSSVAKENYGYNSQDLPLTKENELYHQKSLLIPPSKIKFRRKNHTLKGTSALLDYHKSNENEGSDSKSKFSEAASDITKKISNLENILKHLSTEIERIQMDIMSKEQIREETKIRKIVHEEIVEVEKEKLGLPDFALEASGGSIIGTPNTKTYATRTVVQLFGFPLWYVETSPRNAIQASVSPGECWTFHGAVGNLRIQLAAPAILFGFSLYHIPKEISLSGDITSSPREFSVVGFNDLEEPNLEILLGEYEYNSNGPPLQTFAIQRDVSVPLSMVELRIHSNYGQPEFTCLYRFQVHGRSVV